MNDVDWVVKEGDPAWTATTYGREPAVEVLFDPDEVALAFTVQQLGADKGLWASDYPHPDAKIPGVTKELAESIADLSPADQARIAGGNAVDLYLL